MTNLTITDVGPITKTAKIEFRRFCILIGPQSHGKSTIAKILSTCLWLEKEACTSLSEQVIKDGLEFKTLLEGFHRIHDYIHPDRSVIDYESDYVKIIYDKGNFNLSFKDNLAYERTKISYVPSDRNVVTMKDIEKRELEPTNFRSFLFDWLDTNRNFDSEHKIPILNLGMKYYYNDRAKERMDMLSHENGVTYNISLYDASSGMQSLVPMTVLMHYLVTDYFKNYGKDISFEQKQKNRDLLFRIAEKASNKEDMSSKMIDVSALYERLTSPHSITFILEEPEQNLFPQTQVSLFNDIIALCSSSHPSSAFITTHSPYILAAANILLFADKLKKTGVPQGIIADSIGMDASIAQNEFSAYTVSDGTCASLIDPDTGLIQENELDSASDYNAAVFEKLYSLYVKNLQEK